MKKVTNQLKTGSLLSYVQMGMNIVIGLVYTPVMLRLLGQGEYGLYNTVSSTILMLSVLSLGFNSGYIKYYAKYKKENNEDAIYRLNGLFLLIFCLIGIVALCCGVFLSYNLHMVFDNGLTADEYNTAKILMLLLTMNLSISFPMSVFQNIISANERFVFLKLLGFIKTVLTPLVTLPVLLWGYGSVGLVVVTVFLSLLVDIVYCFYVVKVLDQRFIFKGFEKGLFSSLFVYTVFIAINIVIDQINWSVDKLLLGRYQGTVSVAIYAVGFSLYGYYQTFSTSISGMFTPRIHHMYNEFSDNTELLSKNLTQLFTKVGRLQFLILGLVSSGVCIFGKQFIRFWAGEGYDDSYYVAILLILPATISLIQNVGIEIQRAENLHRFRSIAYLIMAIINLISSIFLCQVYGAIGAACGTAVSLIIANGFVMNIYYQKKCHINVIEFWKNILKMLPGLVIPTILGFVFNRFITYSNIIMLGLAIVIYTMIYFVSTWFLSMNKYERSLVCKPFSRLYVKFFHRKK